MATSLQQAACWVVPITLHEWVWFDVIQASLWPGMDLIEKDYFCGEALPSAPGEVERPRAAPGDFFVLNCDVKCEGIRRI